MSKHTDPIQTILQLSNEYGADPLFTLAGGGNTSVKQDATLHVKASGYPLATLTADGLVELDRAALQSLVERDLGANPVAREAAYKKALHAARTDPEATLRPSVESIVHEVIPGRYVVHTHPRLVNCLTCAKNGEALADELFGDEIVWVEYVDPGFKLAQVILARLRDWQEKTGKQQPLAIFLDNHGLIIAGDSPEQVRERTDTIIARLAERLPDDLLAIWPSGDAVPESSRAELVRQVSPLLRGLLGHDDRLPVVRYDDSPLAIQIASNEEALAAVERGALTPDQIVYCQSFPLLVESVADHDVSAILEMLRAELKSYEQENAVRPKVVIIKGLGLFFIGDTPREVETTQAIYLDAVQVMAGAMQLGGVDFLNAEQRGFIESWEVEAYRKKISAGPDTNGRAAGKIAIVTGGAQGFGLEIAEGFAAAGGIVVLTDINVEGAQAAAEAICDANGRGQAIGLAINVTDPDSVQTCLDQVVRTYGGFDVFISNAGVLKAGSVKTLAERDFDFVTNVNYKGYFVCTKYAAPILATQHRAAPDLKTDIIQINSKSGLVGSNKNGAYAGSKFGGIGLTQSFALELIADGIKVNSICPGNFFDGPLWSDPDRGLFVQYLRTGKVPGAKTIEDVKHFYEAKVPMARGCTTPDVLRAIFYLIEQQYETGQALPVTGGQVMLA